jgi:hypothetical protein
LLLNVHIDSLLIELITAVPYDDIMLSYVLRT